MPLGERTHLHRVVGNECRLYERRFALFAEYLVDELALAHGIVHFQAQFPGKLPQFGFLHPIHIEAGMFFDGVENSDAPEGRLEADDVVAYRQFSSAVQVKRYFFQ